MNNLADNIPAKGRMNKIRLQISVLVAMLFSLNTAGQGNYPLYVQGVDRDSSFIVNELGITTNFSSRLTCIDYVNKLPGILQGKGYVTASIDSLRFDSSFASMVLFVGNVYRWASLDASQVDPQLLDAIGWRPRALMGSPWTFSRSIHGRREY